jgi:hypothetical protein
MSAATTERLVGWIVYAVAFALLWLAVYRTDGLGQATALAFGAALIRLSGYIAGNVDRDC